MRYIVFTLLLLSLLITPVFASTIPIEDDQIMLGSPPLESAASPVDFTILIQPVSRTVSINDIATFSVLASGDDLTYRWYYSVNGGQGWIQSSSATSGYNTSTLSVVGTSNRNGFLYKCKISNSSGELFSAVATLSVVSNDLPNTVDPVDILFLTANSVLASTVWFEAILTASGMSGLYITMIVIFLVVSLLMAPILGGRLRGSDHAIKSRSEKNNDSDG